MEKALVHFQRGQFRERLVGSEGKTKAVIEFQPGQAPGEILPGQEIVPPDPQFAKVGGEMVRFQGPADTAIGDPQFSQGGAFPQALQEGMPCGKMPDSGMGFGRDQLKFDQAVPEVPEHPEREVIEIDLQAAEPG
jgi:hypothetical protein